MGRVPLGPWQPRNLGGQVMVLPLRIETATVELIDDAWRRMGLRNRMELFRAALGAYFESTGEVEIAALLGGTNSARR